MSVYHASAKFKVYNNDFYRSDKWDPQLVGRDFDFSKTFTENMLALKHDAPIPSIDQSYNENSDYTEHASHLKNCYLCFASVIGEDLIHCCRLSKCNASVDGTSMT